MNSFMNSGSGSRTVSTVCVVRKPSCTLKNGVCVASAARRRDQAEVAGLLGVAAEDHAPAAVGHDITSSCPAWTFSPWLVSARAPMFITTGSRLPEIV